MHGWRTVGRWARLDDGLSPPVEPLLPPRLPPRESSGARVSFRLDGRPLPVGATAGEKERAATYHPLPQCAVWLWTDGSMDGDTTKGVSGALVSGRTGRRRRRRS